MIELHVKEDESLGHSMEKKASGGQHAYEFY
jgi:hypothetical protein